MGKYEKLVVIPHKGNFYITGLTEDFFDVRFFPEGTNFSRMLTGSVTASNEMYLVHTPEAVIPLDMETYFKLIETLQC